MTVILSCIWYSINVVRQGATCPVIKLNILASIHDDLVAAETTEINC